MMMWWPCVVSAGWVGGDWKGKDGCVCAGYGDGNGDGNGGRLERR